MTGRRSISTNSRGIKRALSLAAAMVVPAAAARAVDDVAGDLLTFKQNGAWSWFQDDRIIFDNGKIIFGTVAGVTDASATAGDVQISSYSVNTGAATTFTLAPAFQRDDHDAPAISKLPDGRYLAIWEKHASDDLMWRGISTAAGSVASWGAAASFDANPANDGNGNTYANVYRLSSEGNKIYNFSRSVGFDPNYMISTDGGNSFTYGGRLLTFTNPLDGSRGRPYVRYNSNDTDTIWLTTTDDHPRNYPNSIYAGYIRTGNVYQSNGALIGPLSTSQSTSIAPSSFTKIFQGDANHVGWTIDLEIDPSGNPYTAFQVRHVGGTAGDIRYWYARWTGSAWQANEIAYAGSALYSSEGDYSGLVALDPNDRNTLFISTNANPVTGAPLISNGDQQRHWEIYQGTTTNGGVNWSWTPITSNSTVDNIRPIIPEYTVGSPRPLVWLRGDYSTYADYDTDVVGLLTGAAPPTLNRWNNDGSGNWETTGNWTVGIPNAVGAVAIFGTGPTPPTQNSTISITGTKTLGAITFDHPTYSYSLAMSIPGGSLSLNNGVGVSSEITVNSGNHTISLPVAIDSDGVVVSTAAGASLTMSGNLSGAGGITKVSPGTLVLTGVNTQSGATTIASGTLRVPSVISISSNSNMNLSGGTFEPAFSFSRSIGTGASQIQLTGGPSGFSAGAPNVTVSLLNGASPIDWGSSTFAPSTLVLTSTAVNNLTLDANLNLNGATRTIQADGGLSTMSGVISGTSGQFRVFGGSGTLVLSNASNTYAGGTSIGPGGAGVLRAAASNALGTGSVSIASGGNSATGRLELSGNITLPNAISLSGRNNDTVAIENISGAGTLAGLITITTGGTRYWIQSDAGTLTLAGGVTSSATSTRELTLRGAGNGVVTGSLTNGAAVLSVTKLDAGTWTLAGSGNNYTGPTTVNAGKLVYASTFASPASLTVANGAAVEVSPGANKSVKFASLNLNSTGTLDVNDNKLIVQFGTSASPLAAIRQYIVNGRGGTDFGGGNWQGPGINSSAAAASDGVSFAIGYVENSYLPTLGLPSYTAFGGQSVDSGSLLVRYTLGADVNLDGKVNTDDVTIIGADYNNPGTGHWFLGDFDYDGICDTDDVTVLGAMYDPTGPALSNAQLTAQYGTDFAAAFERGQALAAGEVMVPEPASLASLGVALTVLAFTRLQRRLRTGNKRAL